MDYSVIANTFRNILNTVSGLNNSLWFGLVVGMIGVLSAVLGVIFLAKVVEYKTNGISTVGYVQSVQRTRRIDSNQYYSFVSFQDNTGSQRQVIFQKRLVEGRSVPLLYLTYNPDGAIINSMVQIFFSPVFLIFLGGIFFAFGAPIVLSNKINKPSIS